MPPFLPVRHLLQYVRRRLVNHLNAGEIWQVPDLLWQGAVCPLYNLLKAFGICDVRHEANFTTRTSGETWAGGRFCWEVSQSDNCCTKTACLTNSETQEKVCLKRSFLLASLGRNPGGVRTPLFLAACF